MQRHVRSHMQPTGKAARARELKKNREQRDQAREVTLVKRDTRGIERDLRALQDKASLTSAEKEELDKLQSELRRIKEAKDEYLVKNPDHRKFVYPREQEEKAEQAKRDTAAQEAQRRKHPQRDPRRSVYYHEIYNPLGAPPPGMPFMEKPAEEWEAEQRREFDRLAGDGSDEDEEDGDNGNSSDEEIMMPAGPPPPRLQSVENEEEEDSSEEEDGIVMPKGPPPAPPAAPKAMQQRPPAGPSASFRPRPPLPATPAHPPRPPMPPSFGTHQARPMQHALRPGWSVPPRPYAGSIQPSPAPPSAPGPPPARPPTVISAAPVMRDLKKEATAFVPTALRKKQAAQRAMAAKGGLPVAVNAAPGAGAAVAATSSPGGGSEAQDGAEELEARVGLMDTLKPHFGTKVGPESNDDYRNFLGELDDLL